MILPILGGFGLRQPVHGRGRTVGAMNLGFVAMLLVRRQKSPKLADAAFAALGFIAALRADKVRVLGDQWKMSAHVASQAFHNTYLSIIIRISGKVTRF